MSAYITVSFTPTNKEELQRYSSSVPEILKKYSGEYLAKGESLYLHGEPQYQMQVILVFPSKEHALSWYNSEEYQALLPIRDRGMRSQFQLIS